MVLLTSFMGFYLSNETVAFSAVLNRNQTSNGYIILDKFLTYVGNTYNSTTGAFTCPDDALYMFTWSVTDDVGDSSLYLRLNGSNVQRMFLSQASGTSHTSSTNGQSKIMRCFSGDVFALFLQSSSQILLADYTMFTGCKLPS